MKWNYNIKRQKTNYKINQIYSCARHVHFFTLNKYDTAPRKLDLKLYDVRCDKAEELTWLKKECNAWFLC